MLVLLLHTLLNYGATVTWWILGEGYNKKVGGGAGSKHLTGRAVDVVFESKATGNECRTALEELGFTVVQKKTYTHVEW